jgi:hypothetical protein
VTQADRPGGEGFLARWSERKRSVRETEAAEEKAEEKREERAEAEDEETLAANRAAAEAIDLDSLTVGSDMSPFYKPGVPAALKQLALRKLWRSDPVFAVQDGLDIYRENFHDPSYLLTGGSSWVPGSGYAQRFAELKEQAEKALVEAKARAGELAPEDSAEAVEPVPGVEAQAEPAAAEAPQPAELAESAEPAETTETAEAVPDEAEEAEPAPRVPLRARLDFAAFKDEG